MLSLQHRQGGARFRAEFQVLICSEFLALGYFCLIIHTLVPTLTLTCVAVIFIEGGEHGGDVRVKFRWASEQRPWGDKKVS